MKKVILSLVFVLATGVNFMNANTTTENTLSDDCDAVYFAVRDVVTAIVGDSHVGILAAIRAEETCLEAEEELEIIE